MSVNEKEEEKGHIGMKVTNQPPVINIAHDMLHRIESKVNMATVMES